MTLKQLQVFLAVARYENLTLAAEKLFLSKGAVSQALQELEKYFGVQLFDRVHPHIRLNHDGSRLRPLADEIIQRSQEAEGLFRSEGGHFLNIGVSKTIGTYILPNLLKSFSQRHGWVPKGNIDNTNNLLDQVASFELDVVLLEGEKHYPDMMAEKWLDDEMVVVACKGHPLANGVRHPPQALAGQPWILREPGSGSRDFFEHTLGMHLSSYEVAQSLNLPGAILAMVQQGMGITFVSRMATYQNEFESFFSVINLTQQFSRIFSICYHSRKYHSPSMEQFLAFCRLWKPVLRLSSNAMVSL